MNWKLALTAIAGLAIVLSACTKEEKPKAKPAPKAAECKLAGDWAMEQLGDDVADNKKRVLTLSFNQKAESGNVATGELKVGTRDPDPSTFKASASVKDTIESGGAAALDWTFSNQTISCEVKFVSECEALQFKCPEGDTFEIKRK